MLASILLLLIQAAGAAGLKDVPLPKPRTTGGKPLMEALSLRRSTREFAADPLPLQTLSDLLWAAWGFNRPQERKRTAPSASDKQEIDVYVATADGLFLYDASGGALKAVSDKDVRALTGTQDFVAQAPVNLVYVADTARMGGGGARSKDFYSAADAGFIAENAYLFCASEGLAAVVRGSIERERLARAMGLRPAQKIVLAQSVGFPRRP